MLMLFTGLFGFLAPFIPELIKLFTRKQDYAQELEMFRLRLQAGSMEHTWRMEEVDARADIAESIELRKPQPSYGIQLLDAAVKDGWSRWLIAPIFYLFAFLDFLSGSVRPVITYWAFGFYIFYKYASYEVMKSVSDPSFTWAQGIMNLWGENDWAVLTLVMGFWFGQRGAKYAFGKSGSRM